MSLLLGTLFIFHFLSDVDAKNGETVHVNYTNATVSGTTAATYSGSTGVQGNLAISSFD